MGSPKGISRQQGVALILVLLVVALMSLVATALMSRVGLDVRRVANQAEARQAQWYGLGGERLARGLIEASLRADDRIHLEQAWASPLLSYPIDGGFMQLAVEDLQSCFNLNALSATATPQGGETEAPARVLAQFESLVRAVDEEGLLHPRGLLEPLRDWLDADTLPTGLAGAEDLYYTRLDPPYLPANGPLGGVSEINLTSGVRDLYLQDDEESLEVLRRLQDFLCALPTEDWVLNLNTLGEDDLPLLMALFEGELEREQLEDWLAQRPPEGYREVDEFWSHIEADEALSERLDSTVKEQLAVTSGFFLARVQVSLYDAQRVVRAWLRVEDGQPRTWRRQYGVLD